MIPSHAMVFTDDEKRKYRVDGFRADRSDMPTLRGILRRAEADPGLKCTWGSARDGCETIERVKGHFERQQQQRG